MGRKNSMQFSMKEAALTNFHHFRRKVDLVQE